MTNVQFSFTRSEDGTETIVLVGAQGVRVVPDTHVNFETIKSGLLRGDSEESGLYTLADAATKVADTLHRLSERVTIKGDTVYFDGDPMETRLTRHIVEMIKSGDENFAGYVAFLENVQANPSKASRKALFKFLDKHDLVITDDGCFIGYKGIGDDGLSITVGHEDVTVTLPDGTVEVHKGRIPNPVGAVVEMPRSLVDDNRDVACSVGLHVGEYSYATGFGQKLLTVKVNPRDVVSVPSDSNDQKIRTHRYTVLETNDDHTRYTGTSYGYVPDAEGVDDEDEYDEDLDYDDEPFTY